MTLIAIAKSNCLYALCTALIPKNFMPVLWCCKEEASKLITFVSSKENSMSTAALCAKPKQRTATTHVLVLLSPKRYIGQTMASSRGVSATYKRPERLNTLVQSLTSLSTCQKQSHQVRCVSASERETDRSYVCEKSLVSIQVKSNLCVCNENVRTDRHDCLRAFL